MKKCANELNKAFSKEVQKVKKNEEMLNIPKGINKGNANQNQVKIAPHSC
jgi:hypothetical protein